MALFKINNSNVIKLSTIDLEKERNIQRLFENNLLTILNVDFLASECSTSFGGRIDTLGIDKNGSPVIVEYKRNQNDNIINQGLSYLKWLLDHKADFEMLCRNKNISLEIDWTSPRVICVAESYNKFDLDTVEILPIKIELLRYRIYENDILLVESETQKAIKISTSKIYQNENKDRKMVEAGKKAWQTRLQKNYTIENHLEIASNQTKELFMQLKAMISSLDEAIIEEAKAKYIAYKLTTNFVDIVLQKNAIKAFLNVPSGKLNDSFGIARDLSKPKAIGHWGNGDYEVVIKNEDELKKLFELIKQSYNYNK